MPPYSVLIPLTTWAGKVDCLCNWRSNAEVHAPKKRDHLARTAEGFGAWSCAKEQ
jgi:hypothetical protein